MPATFTTASESSLRPKRSNWPRYLKMFFFLIFYPQLFSKRPNSRRVNCLNARRSFFETSRLVLIAMISHIIPTILGRNHHHSERSSFQARLQRPAICVGRRRFCASRSIGANFPRNSDQPVLDQHVRILAGLAFLNSIHHFRNNYQYVAAGTLFQNETKPLVPGMQMRVGFKVSVGGFGDRKLGLMWNIMWFWKPEFIFENGSLFLKKSF